MKRRRQSISRQAWALQRERLQLADPRPPEPEAYTTPGDVIPALMKQWGLEQRLWEQEMLREWPALAGDDVARHTRPGRLERKILLVYVRHPVWLSELSRYGKPILLANLQRRFGADRIRDVRLQLDPDAAAP